MPRPTSPQLTPAEQRVMNILWERGEASVRELTDALEDAHGLAYTTILTTVRIMAEKGYLDFRKEGRAHIFWPVVSREGARRTALGSLVKNLFDGSPRTLAQHLIDDEKLSLDDIESLRERLLAKSGEDE